jgi:hypothetical protein
MSPVWEVVLLVFGIIAAWNLFNFLAYSGLVIHMYYRQAHPKKQKDVYKATYKLL